MFFLTLSQDLNRLFVAVLKIVSIFTYSYVCSVVLPLISQLHKNVSSRIRNDLSHMLFNNLTSMNWNANTCEP